MKKLLCFVALVCLLATTAHAQTLGWEQIPNTKIGGDNTSCSGNCGVAINYPQSRNVIAAWGGGVMDTTRNRLVVSGGGHNDYSGNEIYAVDFDGTPVPLRLTNNTNPSGCGLPSCDGGITPNSRHTYHNFTYVPSSDSMFVFGGGLSGSGVTSYNDAWQFKFADSTWTHLNPISTGMFDSPTYFIYFVEYYAPMDAVLIVGQYGLYKYDLNTRAMTALRTTGGGTGYAHGAIDPVKQRLYIFEQAFTQNQWVDLTGADGYAYHGFTPTGDTSKLNSGFTGWAFDPVSGDLVGWNGGSTVYRFNTTTNNITAVTNYTGGPPAAQANGTYGRWQYSPTLNAFVVVNSFDQNAFVFRLNGGSPPPPPDTQAPTAPSGLMTSGVTDSQVTLSWSASTDNVAVTGYRIERCSGVSCSNFAQVGTPAGTLHADTGLTASTNYTYRVRATDAAGNLSAYSSTVSVTTASPPPPGVITVGPGKQFQTICAAVAAAVAGSTIEIDAGIYPNESCTLNLNNVTIKALGGQAHLRWGTGDHTTHASLIPNGKGIFIVQGDNITLENLEFSGAKVADENGAGIRYEGGNLTIRNSKFHDNENGILGQGGLAHTLWIEGSIFERNGYCPSGFCAHNLYIGTMGRFVFFNSKSVDPREGHTLKSRSQVTEILYSFLSTKNSDGSYEIDLPNGGRAFVIGNVIEQGANTGNSSILAWGAEGATNPNPELRVINNTFYNWRTSGATFVQVSGSVALSIKNNIFAGGGVQLVGGATDLASNKTSSAFVNTAAGDFHLTSSSDAINAGVAPGTAGGYDLTPVWEYVEPAGKITRTLTGTIDVGAYESNFAPPPPPPPPSNPCVTFPYNPTIQAWPKTTGSTQGRWNANGRQWVSASFKDNPMRFESTSKDGCMATVVKP